MCKRSPTCARPGCKNNDLERCDYVTKNRLPSCKEPKLVPTNTTYYCSYPCRHEEEERLESDRLHGEWAKRKAEEHRKQLEFERQLDRGAGKFEPWGKYQPPDGRH